MEMEHQKLAIAYNFKCYIENTMWHINNESPERFMINSVLCMCDARA